MSAKRRRLDDDYFTRTAPGEGGPPEQQEKAASASTVSVVTEETPSHEDDNINAKLLKTMKQRLSKKKEILSFMEQKAAHDFSYFVGVYFRYCSDLNRSLSRDLVRACLSIFGNCCNYSVKACMILKNVGHRFTAMLCRIIDHPEVSDDIKASIARLVANISARKESNSFVVSNSLFMDKFSAFLDIDNEHCTVQTIRAMRYMSAAGFSKALVQANAASHLGKLLAVEKKVEDVMAIIIELAKKYAKETGRQLAGSGCAKKLREFFVSREPLEYAVVVANLAEASPDVRERLGEENAIEEISSGSGNDALTCRMLCAFAQDAWGRVKLRELGGLDQLITFFSESESLNDRCHVAQSFRHFVHDTFSMAHIAHDQRFFDTIVRDVANYLEKCSYVCKPLVMIDGDIISQEDHASGDFTISSKSRQSPGPEEACLHKDFSLLWDWEYCSTTSNRRVSGSPGTSPPSSGALSPSSSLDSFKSAFSGSPSMSSVNSRPTSSVAELDDIPGIEDAQVSNELLREKKLVESELYMWSWQAQEDANLARLLRNSVVNTLIAYLTKAPSNDFRAGRILRRLASTRIFTEELLQMQFSTKIADALCMTPCRVVRYARRCQRCERTAEFGRELLRLFGESVGSDFGQTCLTRRLASDDLVERTLAAVAMLSMRDRSRPPKRFNAPQIRAITTLFASLRSLCSKENFDAIGRNSTYENGPSLCCQVLRAMSTMIPVSNLKDIFGVLTSFQPNKLGLCVVQTSKNIEVERLVFVDQDGTTIASIPFDALFDNSEYFKAMFSANLSEKSSNKREFVFDPAKEHCSSDSFRAFLHYLAGCRDSCVTVSSTIRCVEFIYLADRYLCTSLFTDVCGAHGAFRRLLTGSSVQHFLPIVLRIHEHERLSQMCILTLMRFATNEDVVSTISALLEADVVSDFLQEFNSYFLSFLPHEIAKYITESAA